MSQLPIVMVPSRDGAGSNIFQSPQKSYSIAVVDDPVLGTAAPRVWRAEVHVGDFWSGDVNRSDGELHNRVELIMSPNQSCAGYPSTKTSANPLGGIPWFPSEGDTIWEQWEYMIPSSIALPRTSSGGTYTWQMSQTNSSKSDKHYTGSQIKAVTSEFFGVQNGNPSIQIPAAQIPRDVWLPIRIRTVISSSSTTGEMQAWWWNGTSWVAGIIIKGATRALNADGTYVIGAHRKIGLYRMQPPSGGSDDRGILYISDYNLQLSQSALPQPREVRYSSSSGGTTVTLPAVIVDAASAITQTTATLNGSVNPNNGATTWQFEWGTDGVNFPNRAPATAGSISAGTSVVTVSTGLTGLTGGSTVNYRLVATNSAGTTRSVTRTFTTTSASVPDGSTFLESFDTSPPSGSFIFGDNSVNAGALSQRVTTADPRAEWSSEIFRGLSRRYYAIAPLPSVSSGQVEFTYTAVVVIDASTRMLVQRYVNTIQTPMTDKLRFRLVRSRTDSTTGLTVVDDPDMTSINTPLVSGQPPGGLSTVKGLAISILGDGETWLPLYSTDVTESTAEVGATWIPAAPARKHPVKIDANTQYTFRVNTSLMQGSGTVSLAQTFQAGGSKRTQAGVDLTPATTAAALAGTNPYLIANLPGGATGQTPAIPKAGYTPDQRTFTAPITTAQTVPAATGQASGNYRIDFLSCNIGSNPSNAALAMLTHTYLTNGWEAGPSAVNGDIAAWSFKKKLTGSETSPTIQHSDPAASVTITQTLWTGQDPTLAVDEGTSGAPSANAGATAAVTSTNGGESARSDTAATLTHPLTDTVVQANGTLIAFSTHDAATGQTGQGFSPPVIGATPMTELVDWVSTDASSNLRQAVAYASPAAGTYAPSFMQTAGPADQGIQFGIALRAAPGSGGTGGASGVQEPLITAIYCYLPTTGKVGLWGFESAAGVEGRSGFVADPAATGTPGWAIYKDAAGGQGGDSSVVPVRNPTTEPVLIVEQKSGGSSGNIKTHVFRRSTFDWNHSADNIGPLASGAAIPGTGHFIVGQPFGGATGFVLPAAIAVVGYARASRILTNAEVEQLVNSAGIMTKFRWRNVLSGLINQNGNTDDSRLYKMTTGTTTWTDEMGTGVALTVGAGTVSQATITAPYLTGTDETPAAVGTIGDPSGLTQVGSTVLHTGDTTLMDFAVKMNANSAADQALTGFGYVFFMKNPDDSDTAPATQIATATTAPTQGSPLTITVPVQAGNIEVFAIAKSNTQTSGRSPSILVSPPVVVTPGTISPVPAASIGTVRTDGGLLDVYWPANPVGEGVDEYDIFIAPTDSALPSLPTWEGSGLPTVTFNAQTMLHHQFTGLDDTKSYQVGIRPTPPAL
jgi:hypothetical protein